MDNSTKIENYKCHTKYFFVKRKAVRFFCQKNGAGKRNRIGFLSFNNLLSQCDKMRYLRNGVPIMLRSQYVSPLNKKGLRGRLFVNTCEECGRGMQRLFLFNRVCRNVTSCCFRNSNGISNYIKRIGFRKEMGRLREIFVSRVGTPTPIRDSLLNFIKCLI